MMMFIQLVAVSICAAVGSQPAANPLFQELLQRGAPVSSTVRLPLPPPAVPDGLDAAAQQAALAKIVGERYSLDEFARDSVVAPFLLKFPEVRRTDAPARAVDLWFIVYGNLNQMSKNDVLKEFTTARGKDATLHVLTADELTARQLSPASGANENLLTQPGQTAERYVHTIAGILDKVELHQTLRCVLSRNADSVVIATVVDDRFDKDRDFPNQYHRLVRNDAGDTAKGPAEPYAGAAGYLKATQLAQPNGAILVEYHAIYSEPQDWFNGANLLQSKLPILLQSRVRDLRRQVKNK